MPVAERIYWSVRKLPGTLQTEVLDFVEYLLSKAEHASTTEEEEAWSGLSLELAMRDMESEDTPSYSTDDIKEQYT